MDIMQIWSAYHKDANPDAITPMYQQCEIHAKARGYGDANLLHIASQNAHPEAVAWLLEKGLDPNEASSYGHLPLFLLAGKDFSSNYPPREGDIYRTALLLLDGGAKPSLRDPSGKFCYHVAAQEGNVEFLRALVDRGVRLTRTDPDGNTALHLLVEACSNPLEALEAVDKEMEEKRNEDSLPPKRRSPITMKELEQRKQAIEASLEDLFRCAVILKDAGVDPEAENHMMETAHTLAVRRGAKKIAALLDGSLSPEDADTAEGREKIAAGGMTLHQAVRQSDAEAVRALVKMGEDINAISEQHSFEGLSPLAVACQTCDIPMATLLLGLGADPTLRNGEGEQPIVALFSSLITRHPPKNLYEDRLAARLLALLVRHGFDVNSSLTDWGDCLLGVACASSYGIGFGRDSVIAMVVEEAIRLGADVDRKNFGGQTPLMLSCKGDFRTMEAVQTELLEAGADAALRDMDGNTALHYAARNPSPSAAVAMTELLFELGKPDPATVNVFNKTALDYAVEQDNAPLVKLLLRHIK